MVPSLLPAFSAPTAVSVPPSCLASSGVTAACAPVAASSAASMMVCLKFMVSTLSEGGLESRGQEATVFEQRRHAAVGSDGAGGRVGHQRAEEVDILQVEAVLLAHVERHANRIVAGALVAARLHGGLALQADRTAERHRH